MLRVIQPMIKDGVVLFPMKRKREDISPCTLELFLFPLTRASLSTSLFQSPDEDTMPPGDRNNFPVEVFPFACSFL